MPLSATVSRSGFRTLVIAPLIISATLHFRPAAVWRFRSEGGSLVISGYDQHALCKTHGDEGGLGRTATFSGSVRNTGRNSPSCGNIQARTNSLHFYFPRFCSVNCQYRICPHRLCVLVARVPGYRSRDPGFDSRRYQFFSEK
jgi:hypothetical protein